jgi:hypothetical protein
MGMAITGHIDTTGRLIIRDAITDLITDPITDPITAIGLTIGPTIIPIRLISRRFRSSRSEEIRFHRIGSNKKPAMRGGLFR